jgi:hypothetical protein
VRQDMRARLVTGAERATWWERAVAAFPDYAAYQQKTEREIPVFVPAEIDRLRELEPTAVLTCLPCTGSPAHPESAGRGRPG